MTKSWRDRQRRRCVRMGSHSKAHLSCYNFCCCHKTLNKKHLGRKCLRFLFVWLGFFFFLVLFIWVFFCCCCFCFELIVCSPPLREVKTGTEAKPWRSDENWLVSYELLNCFLLHPRTTCLAVAPPTMGWTLPSQSSTKKMHHRHSHRTSWRRHFLSWGS